MDGTIAKVPLFFQFFYSLVPKIKICLPNFWTKIPKSSHCEMCSKIQTFLEWSSFWFFQGFCSIPIQKINANISKNSQKTNSDLCAGYNLHIYSPIQKFCYLSFISKFQNFYSIPKQVGYIFLYNRLKRNKSKTGVRKTSYRKTSTRFITCVGH